MDNMRDFTPETRVKRGRGILVVTAILLVLATLAVILCVSMSVSCMEFAFADEVGLDGLALIVLLPGMVIFAVVGLILSVIASILAGKVRRSYIGREKIFGTVSKIVSIIYILVSVILPIVTIILLQQ